MYRYSLDKTIIYTSEDFVLFRESVFACWMERLTLENPDHGIPPDIDSTAPHSLAERQDDIADTLLAEGRDVALIDWDEDEAVRRAATLQAMRNGTDFIVNGQLALGPLSGTANLLLRTSGYSELGDFLYIPCDTQTRTSLNSAFRLCFLADLLHGLQGQLPPQMLIIRSGADLVPLQTEDHVYHYRAVKQRFMAAMREFRKHCMPDPAESSHFGRWSDCANEVLKQRALREETLPETVESVPELSLPRPVAAVAGGSTAYDLDEIDDHTMPGIGMSAAMEPVLPGATDAPRATTVPEEGEPGCTASGYTASGYTASGYTASGYTASAYTASAYTLAEQARRLPPGAFRPGPDNAPPGPTPNLARVIGIVDGEGARREVTEPELDRQQADSDQPATTRRDRRSSDWALENLQFIGSRNRKPRIRRNELPQWEKTIGPGDTPSPQAKPHPLDSAGFSITADAVIDWDEAPPASHDPVLPPADPGLDFDDAGNGDCDGDVPDAPPADEHQTESEAAALVRSFSNSLITNDHYPE